VSDAAERPPPRGRAALFAGALLGIAGWTLFSTSLAAESVQWAPHAPGGWAADALLGLARTLTARAASGEPGGGAGLLWPMALALSLVAATAGWSLAVRAARERALPLAALLALTLAFAALANAAPGLFSSDVYAYIRLGRMAALLGANPFREAPLAVPDGYVDDRWFMAEHVSPYGPLWIAVAAALAKLAELARLGFGDFVQLHRWLATLCHCANAVLIHRIAEGRRRGSGSAACAAYALCPLAIVEVCAGAHNEVFLIVLLLLGIAQVLRSRPWLASALFAAASLIKPTALLAWAAHAVLVARTARGPTEAVRSVSAIGLGAAALAAIAYLPFWNGAGALASLEMLLGLLFGGSPTNSLAEWLGVHVLAAGGSLPLGLRLAGAFCGVAFLGTVAVQLARTRDRASFLRAIHAGFFAWSAFGASWNQPWYALTATAMAAIAPPSRLRDATWLLSVSVLAMYPLHAFGDPALYAHRGLAMGGIPLAYLGLALLADRLRPPRPGTLLV
jgi:hypothetical protein